MNTITASVVLYKTPNSQLKRLLECIQRSSVAIHLYLIDNSPDPVHPSIFDLPWTTYIKAATNRGYGAGHNIALRQTLDAAEFHFVLNPDVYFGPKELERMIQFMRNDSTIGQLMPKVIYPDGTTQYLCKLIPTPADLFFRRFMFGPFKALVRRKIEHFELRFTDYDREMNIPYLSGCFMLFRTASLREVGLFDERFFMYPEDIDITRRMHAKFRTVFFPGATIIHDHARDSYKSKRALWIHLENSIRYFNKWGWFYDPQRSKVNQETLRQF